MAEDYKTTEARAFQEHFSKLLDAITAPDLPVLGAHFFSRKIISKETMEMAGNALCSRAERASALLLAVMAALEAQPDKFESALEVLTEEHVYAHLAAKIKESFTTNKGLNPKLQQPFQSPAVKRYSDYLKKLYLRSKVPVKESWARSPCKKIIKLAAIEKKEIQHTPHIREINRSESIDEYMTRNSMTQISMEGLLSEKDGCSLKTVVVQGVPGIGKSTFAWKFCRKWAKSKLHQNYNLVILLRMRDKKVQEATQLRDLLFTEDRDLPQEVVKGLFSNGGKGALFILEGVDELPSSCLADGSPLCDLLQGVSLPEVTIVATTRPWAVQTLMEKCGEQISRKVEILGFTREDIERYVSNAFNDVEKVEFMDYIRSNPQLESIMHIPLNAAFLVQIYKQLKQSQKAVPKTLTQLYIALVEGLLYRYTQSVPDFKDFRMITLNNLPEPINTHFQQLCQLAFMSFSKLNVQVSFTDSEAAVYNCFDYLGLMQSSTELAISGTTVTHCFLHFTLQEFLAAYYLSKQDEQTQELFLEVHSCDPLFAVLVRFLLGLNSKSLKFIKPLESGILSNTEMHWLFETQSPESVSCFLGKFQIVYDPQEVNTATDLFALSYCLCHSNCSWKINIDIKALSTVFKATHQGDVYTGCMEDLVVHNANTARFAELLSLPSNLFRNLSDMAIGWKDDCSTIIPMHVRKGFFPALREIYIYYNDCSNSIVLDLLDALRFHKNPVNIAFGILTLDKTHLVNICKAITSDDGPLKLVGLGFEKTRFQDGCIQTLISAIPCFKSIKALFLSYIVLSQDDLELLSVALSLESTLLELDLGKCSIDDEGAEILASGLEDNKKLKQLFLRRNKIGRSGARALASMLTVNSSLKCLDLRGNKSIGEIGALTLINALEENRTMTDLVLPIECEPIEYGSILMKHIRKRKIVKFA